MKAYASQTDKCRSRFMLEYFGQEKTFDCGTCDVCRLKGDDERLRDMTRTALIASISQKGSYTLEDLKATFDVPGAGWSGDWINLLRELIDEGIVPPYGH